MISVRIAVCSLGLALVMATGALRAQTYSLAPAARVNGVEISTSAFERSVEEFMRENKMNIGSVRYPKRVNELRAQVMALLINKELVWQQANALGTVAGEVAVDKMLAELRGQFKSEDAFKARLAIDGFTEESYRDYARRLATWRDYMERVADRATVSDQEIQDFYDANAEKFMAPEMLRARHILLKTPAGPGADDSAVRQRMKQIQSELAQGEDFAILATRYSEDNTAQGGGELGFFARGQMVAPFEEAVFALQPGEVSDIVTTVFGLHLIKLEERQAERKVSLQEAKQQVAEYLMRIKRQQEQEAEIQALREAAQIEILAPL